MAHGAADGVQVDRHHEQVVIVHYRLSSYVVVSLSVLLLSYPLFIVFSFLFATGRGGRSVMAVIYFVKMLVFDWAGWFSGVLGSAVLLLFSLLS